MFLIHLKAVTKQSKTAVKKRVSAARKKLAITCLRAKPLYKLRRLVPQSFVAGFEYLL